MQESSRFQGTVSMASLSISLSLALSLTLLSAGTLAGTPSDSPAPPTPLVADSAIAGASPVAQRGTNPAPSAASRPGEAAKLAAPNLALVRTVSPPDGMSAEMRAALQGLEGLFSRAAERLQSFETQDGTRTLSLEGRFLNVYVARLNADGSVSGACVSSLPEALGAMRPHDPPGPASTAQPTSKLERE